MNVTIEETVIQWRADYLGSAEKRVHCTPCSLDTKAIHGYASGTGSPRLIIRYVHAYQRRSTLGEEANSGHVVLPSCAVTVMQH